MFVGSEFVRFPSLHETSDYIFSLGYHLPKFQRLTINKAKFKMLDLKAVRILSLATKTGKITKAKGKNIVETNSPALKGSSCPYLAFESLTQGHIILLLLFHFILKEVKRLERPIRHGDNPEIRIALRKSWLDIIVEDFE